MSAAAMQVATTVAAPAGAAQRRPTKEMRVLGAFYAGTLVNRFQAERTLADHVLPSTVAALQRKGVTIYRRDIVVPGYRGEPTRCCEYWLAPESKGRAAELLGIASTAGGQVEWS